MSLESITAEWNELSNEYNKLEVGGNVILFLSIWKRKFYLFSCAFCLFVSRIQVMDIMRCWRNLNNYSKNVWKISPINDIVSVKLAVILKSELKSSIFHRRRYSTFYCYCFVLCRNSFIWFGFFVSFLIDRQKRILLNYSVLVPKHFCKRFDFTDKKIIKYLKFPKLF